jgi:hypothetical protein
MNLPLMLAGPLLRRVEPNLVSVWIALTESASIKLSLWEGGEIRAGEKAPLVSGPDPAAQTLRIGQQLHVAVVTLKLSLGNTLQPDRTYSYDLSIQTASGTHTLKSLGLLANDPVTLGLNMKHLALGFETDVLPTFALPPRNLIDLRVVHGSCRRSNATLMDGLAWADDFLSRGEAYKDPLKRPHQMFLTGDQIYADDVGRVQLHMLMELGKQLFPGIEQLPLKRDPVSQATRAPADRAHFPPGQRLKLTLNTARMTSKDGHSHLIAFAEFCAMYLTVWSRAVWDEFPAKEIFTADFTPSPETKDLLSEQDKAADRPGIYDREIAALIEFRRTLPKVRRALASIPTYMMFDDHEITDDWYLNPLWRDRVLTSPLGKTIIRNGMLSYAVFQGWGNDPVAFETGDRKKLLDEAVKLFPANATTNPNETAGNEIDRLLGLDQNAGLAGANPPVKWHYSVPGEKHLVLVTDNRTRRSYVSRVGPPGNVAVTALSEMIPPGPLPTGKEVVFVITSEPVLGPSMFDELFAPILYRAFDLLEYGKLQGEPDEASIGSRGQIGTNPDAIEAWTFDPKTFEALLRRLDPYKRVVILSGDVHYAASNALSYWKQVDQADPARIVQFISSGLQNVMPDKITIIDRTLAFAQRLIRKEFKAERLGWDVTASDLLVFASGVKPVPAIKSRLKRAPVLIPPQILPEGTKLNAAKLPNWSWRTEVILDKRPDSERPKPAQPEVLDLANPNADATEDKEGFRRAGNRHVRQMDKLNHSRQILFINNIGLVRFEKRGEGIVVIHELYGAAPDPDDPLNKPPTPQLYTKHEAKLDKLNAEEAKKPEKALLV